MTTEAYIPEYIRENVCSLVFAHLSGKAEGRDQIDVDNIARYMNERGGKFKGRASFRLVEQEEHEKSAHHFQIQLSRLAPVHTPDGPFTQPSTIVSISTKRCGHSGWEKSELYSSCVFRESQERRGG